MPEISGEANQLLTEIKKYCEVGGVFYLRKSTPGGGLYFEYLDFRPNPLYIYSETKDAISKDLRSEFTELAEAGYVKYEKLYPNGSKKYKLCL